MDKLGIGIDRGYGYTKFYSKKIRGKVPSLIVKISEEEAKEIIKNNSQDKEVIIVKYEEKYSLIGKKVAQIRPKDAKRDLRRTRDNIKEKILFLTATAIATGKDEEIEVIVTTGLPTDDYNKRKQAYKKEIYNNGKAHEIELFIKGRSIKKKIKVVEISVENQPKGTIVNLINKKIREGKIWEDVKNEKVAVCDIGYNTTDLSVYVGKDIVGDESVNFSTKAMNTIIRDAQDSIYRKYGIEKDEEEVIEGLKTGKIKARGREIDISELVKDSFLRKAIEITDEILSNWEGMLDSFDEIYLTGGALENNALAIILQDLFEKKARWKVNVVKNPQIANVYGFFLISESIIQTKGYTS